MESSHLPEVPSEGVLVNTALIRDATLLHAVKSQFFKRQLKGWLEQVEVAGTQSYHAPHML